MPREIVDVKFTKRKGGVAAWHIAAEEDHTNTVIEILRYQNVEGSIHDDESSSPLLPTTNKGHSGNFVFASFTWELIKTKNNGIVGMSTLAYAASFGNSKVRVLSKASGVDPNVGSIPRLACAAEGGHVHVVEKLLAVEEIDVRGGPTALHPMMVKIRSENVVKLLLETQEIDVKYKIEEDGQTALHLALPIIVSQKSIEVVKIHLETPGIDLNIKNSVGESI